MVLPENPEVLVDSESVVTPVTQDPLEPVVPLDQLERLDVEERRVTPVSVELQANLVDMVLMETPVKLVLTDVTELEENSVPLVNPDPAVVPAQLETPAETELPDNPVCKEAEECPVNPVKTVMLEPLELLDLSVRVVPPEAKVTMVSLVVLVVLVPVEKLVKMVLPAVEVLPE